MEQLKAFLVSPELETSQSQKLLNFFFHFSGKLGISQGKATYKYTAWVSGYILVSLDVVATIDQVGMEYEIENCKGCSAILTNLEITVGRIDSISRVMEL